MTAHHVDIRQLGVHRFDQHGDLLLRLVPRHCERDKRFTEYSLLVPSKFDPPPQEKKIHQSPSTHLLNHSNFADLIFRALLHVMIVNTLRATIVTVQLHLIQDHNDISKNLQSNVRYRAV